MRKLAIASNFEGSARTESRNHEEGTCFYAIETTRYQLKEEKLSCTGSPALPRHPYLSKLPLPYNDKG
jgi:hypothetical protein